MKALYTKFREKTKKYDNYVKVVISVTILVIIFTKIDISGIGEMLTKLSLSTWSVILAICAAKFLAQAFCWKFCLDVTTAEEETNSESQPVAPLCKGGRGGDKFAFLKTHTIGMALRFLLPGGTATFGKILYHDPEKRKETFFAIIIEKFYLVWVVWFIASWAVILLPRLTVRAGGETLLSMSSFLQYSLVLPALIISLLPFVLPLLFRKYIRYEYLVKYFESLPKFLLVQITHTILTFTLYYVILQAATGINLSFIQIAMLVALILVPNTIPITFSGLGLREMTAALLLPKLGVPVEIAVGAALLDFTLNAILPAIAGAVLIMKEKK